MRLTTKSRSISRSVHKRASTAANNLSREKKAAGKEVSKWFAVYFSLRAHNITMNHNHSHGLFLVPQSLVPGPLVPVFRSTPTPSTCGKRIYAVSVDGN